MYSEWSPAGAKEIEIKTWILRKGNYHIRAHHVFNNSSEEVVSQEGALATNIMHDNNVNTFLSAQKNSLAEITTSNDAILIYDLLDARKRRFYKSEPNSNLVSSKVIALN